jgi:pyridinium-3,5-bisthiocarboxylic acid mononucleotide nickel chelatase
MSSPSSPDAPALPPPASLAIHLDLVGGISGDMFVAAIVDALPALAAPVLSELTAMHAAGEPAPGFHEASSGGLRARRFGIAPAAGRTAGRGASAGADAQPVPGRAQALPPQTYAHAHAHVHAGDREHGGTAYALLRRRLADAPLSAPTRERALALLALLAGAEAQVHGVHVDDVHFHELADWDSLMDVVAAGCIAARLDGATWSASALPQGGGSVRTAHGLLPLPAPATSLLLTGYPWHDDGIAGERVTPTGAAILRHLVPAARCGARRDAGRLLGVGCGAGTRALPGLPNIVRALVLDRASAFDADVDVVTVLEFDVDDMTGEEIAVAADRLRATPGAIDVSVGTRHGKKGRPLADFRLLVRTPAADAVAQACFTETSTLGLRWRDERRRVLKRAEVAATVDGVAVDVKVAQRPGGERTAKAAQDDVAATRGLGERRHARAVAAQRALKDAGE